MQEPRLETCPAGEQYQDQLISQQWQAELNHAVSVLQFFLTGGRVAEIRVYPTENGLAYTPHEISGDWWLNGVTGPSPLLAELASRAALPSIPVLWPELTASQANARAARILGERYRMAVEVIQASPAVHQAFGPVQEIRPAIGNNYSSTWMDSSSVFLSFRLLGANGQGAVLIRGYDCFDLLMVFQGIPVEEGNSDICP
jgi:hypothetical protein